MIYGYARCSTNDKIQDITRQIRELEEKGVNKKNIFFEYEKGTKKDRKRLNDLLATITNGDTICATEVSRITRSTKQLCDIIEIAKKQKIKLVLGNFIVDCTKELEPMTEGILKMMGVFAEIERNVISERVKSGIKNAKAKGKIIGRPCTTKEDIPDSFFRNYSLYKNNLITKKGLARLCSLSYPTIYKYINIVEGKRKDEKY